jgi:hypothetical protein
MIRDISKYRDSFDTNVKIHLLKLFLKFLEKKTNNE